MDIFSSIALGVLGFFLGNLLFARVVVVIGAVYEIAKNGELVGSPKLVRIAAVVGLSSGLWLAVIAVVLAYYVSSESWAPPVFWGAVASIAFFTWMSVQLWKKRSNAA